MNQTNSKVRVMATSQHNYKPNLFQAELRQTIIREYNATTVSNNMQSAFAPKEAYNLPESRYEKERVCWVDIPKGWTTERAQQHLDDLYASGAKPCIYQVLSFDPVLTNNDYAWMEKLSDDERQAFIENKKESQMVLNPETGEIATRNGRTIYRKLFYADYQRQDIDLTKSGKVMAAEVKAAEAPVSEVPSMKEELTF